MVPPDNAARLTVRPEEAGARADKWLAARLEGLSRVAVQRAFEAGLVRRGERVLTKSDRVAAGEEIDYATPEVRPSELRAVSIPLAILYEDQHLLALNKAPGMVVHPGSGTGEDTLVHALLAHCRGELSGIGGVERPGIVHRLDKGTSGVLVVAKTDAAHRALADTFASRGARKEYLALVSGVPELLSGSIRDPIGRHPAHRHKMAVMENGRDARTDWLVVESFGRAASLLRCRIHTGRTHQIRVHLASCRHPLLGDAVYGYRQRPGFPEPPRVLLHAALLEVPHPATGAPLRVEAPLPEDFTEMMAALRRVAGG